MRFLILISCCTVLQGCESNPAPASPETIAGTDTASADSLVSAPAVPAQEATADPVSVTCTYTTSWCNGHAPSEEDITDINTPRRLYNMPLLLTSDYTYALQTDKKGRVTASIPPGTYTVRLNNEADYSKSPLFISCDLYFQRSWGEVEIGQGDTAVKINLEFPCDLCNDKMKRLP